MVDSKQLELDSRTAAINRDIFNYFVVFELLHSVTGPESIERSAYIDRHIDPRHKISKDNERLVIKNYTAEWRELFIKYDELDGYGRNFKRRRWDLSPWTYGQDE